MSNLSMVVVSEIDGSGKKVLVIGITLVKVGIGLLLINVVKFVLFPEEEEDLGRRDGVKIRINAQNSIPVEISRIGPLISLVPFVLSFVIIIVVGIYINPLEVDEDFIARTWNDELSCVKALCHWQVQLSYLLFFLLFTRKVVDEVLLVSYVVEQSAS